MKQMNKEIAIKLANDSGGTWNRQLLSDRIQEVLDAKDTAREKALKEAVEALEEISKYNTDFPCPAVTKIAREALKAIRERMK